MLDKKTSREQMRSTITDPLAIKTAQSIVDALNTEKFEIQQESNLFSDDEGYLSRYIESKLREAFLIDPLGNRSSIKNFIKDYVEKDSDLAKTIEDELTQRYDSKIDQLTKREQKRYAFLKAQLQELTKHHKSSHHIMSPNQEKLAA